MATSGTNNFMIYISPSVNKFEFQIIKETEVTEIDITEAGAQGLYTDIKRHLCLSVLREIQIKIIMISCRVGMWRNWGSQSCGAQGTASPRCSE